MYLTPEHSDRLSSSLGACLVSDDSMSIGAGVKEQVCNTMRLAAYAAERSNVVRALLQRMATLPEAVEIGRVTGLTLGQVTWLASVLFRASSQA